MNATTIFESICDRAKHDMTNPRDYAYCAYLLASDYATLWTADGVSDGAISALLVHAEKCLRTARVGSRLLKNTPDELKAGTRERILDAVRVHAAQIIECAHAYKPFDPDVQIGSGKSRGWAPHERDTSGEKNHGRSNHVEGNDVTRIGEDPSSEYVGREAVYFTQSDWMPQHKPSLAGHGYSIVQGGVERLV